MQQKNNNDESFIKTLKNMKRSNDLKKLLNSLKILDESVWENQKWN